jgi:cobalt transporter subunit CbtB
MSINSISHPPGAATAGDRTVGDRTVGRDRTTVGITSVILGVAFIYIVGFAPVSAVHNAAHDTRHSAAFPCH